MFKSLLGESSNFFTSTSKLNAVVARHVKPAQQLMVFDNDQIFKGMEIASAEYPFYWTLETVLKKIIS